MMLAVVSACLQVGTISDYRTPKSHPENPRRTQSMHPCLLVELKRKPTFQHDIYRTFLSTFPNKRNREKNITMVKPFAGSHGMAMLYLAASSLQPLRDGLVERAAEGFY